MSEIDPTLNGPVACQMRAYSNPVYSGYFADPFVWKHNSAYFAVGTGPLEESSQVLEAESAAEGFSAELRLFPLLMSDDFVNWRYYGGALVPPDRALGDTFWAPEVAYSDGTYYLYYSVGFADTKHQIRVATSGHPLGPYTDTGTPLIDPESTPFAIDPHPFQDDDGQWYLFYACDFLDTEDGSRAGTALKVGRLVDMTTVEGAVTVMRAQHDWQRYEANRGMYGRTWDWHTLEGPCVRKHDGRYYCFFSGGRWAGPDYGVDYGVADRVMGPYLETASDGPRVLRTVPDHVLGPGHNSIVVGPDNRTEFVAYHGWDAGGLQRTLRLDRLIWTPEGPRCEGPTWTEQIVEAELTRQDLL